ncbi:MAG: AMP-binding protein, partial [Burkholderiales bacterium]|nr:AMP-binding protein [Burkholderiales bacterium]
MNPTLDPALDPAFDTPAKLLRQRCRQWAQKPALRAKRRGLWSGLSWAGYYEQVRAVGLALAEAGVEHGEVVSVLAENRPEWLLVDLGAQCMGRIGNGIYPTCSAAQVEHILVDSASALVVVENQEQLDKVLAVRARCPALRRIVVIEREGLRGFADPQVGFFDELLSRGRELAATRAADFEAAIDAGRPGDIAFLVYTSGTTGEPKGAMISAANVMAQIRQAPNYLQAVPGDRILSFLPLCHIAERMSSAFNPLALGLVVHFPENAGTVFNDLREVEPQIVFAPPRFWEKLYSQVELAMRDAVAPARWAYARARAAAAARLEPMLQGQGPARRAGLGERLLGIAALHNVRKRLGLAGIKTALTGAAPVSPELVRWYLALGIEL